MKHAIELIENDFDEHLRHTVNQQSYNKNY